MVGDKKISFNALTSLRVCVWVCVWERETDESNGRRHWLNRRLDWKSRWERVGDWGWENQRVGDWGWMKSRIWSKV